jgi:mycothiol synthase
MGITTRDLTPEDAEAAAALMRRIEADHPTGFCLAAHEVVELMTDMPSCVFSGAFDGDELVAYSTVLPSRPSEDGQHFTLFGDVDPRRLGEGLGTRMLALSLGQARAIHARDAPDLPARYASQALAGRDDQAALLRAAGMGAGRHSFLMCAPLADDVPDPVPPTGLTVSAFDTTDAEELREAHNAAFADYPDTSPADPEFWQAFMIGAAHVRHDLSLVARDPDGRVAGYVFTHEYAVPLADGPGREAYVPYVGTLPQHRGRGLATSLLAGVLSRCRARGYARATLNVDTANPTGALGIYERAGFGQVYRQDFYKLEESPA